MNVIDSRLFTAIESLARVQGGLSGVGDALRPMYPTVGPMMENYSDDIQAVIDTLMDVVGMRRAA